ncbi:radical SAM protein [Candidatus Pelagibacter sp.]|nr:radical SAM protein [Candidatus Pelagibacter sp.]
MSKKDYNKIKLWLQNDFRKELVDEIKSELIDILCDNKIYSKDFCETYFKEIAFIIHIFSQKPWITQRYVVEKLNIEKEVIKKINILIRENEKIQKIILDYGVGRKYWKTIIPFAESTKDVLENNTKFPKRIALFPGVSCMFYCGFCGRNQKEKYPTNIVDKSLISYEKIFEEKLHDTAFSISGGLEPLTNPKLGKIIESANKNKIRIPLITNGYSLTDKYIENNPGLWMLDSLRISLYGVDEESYFYITRSKKGFSMVKKNVVNFLTKRNKKNPDLKVGFNFIILSENLNYFSKILDLIKEINKEVKNGRGIDFLSLRDDYQSVTGKNEKDDIERKYRLNGTMKKSERLILMHKIQGFIKRKNEILENLHIDFGYSLENLANGFIGEPLIQVPGDKMRGYGFPQLSVAIDLYGDVFLFREAGFLNREGNKKFIIGRISPDQTLTSVIDNFLTKKTPLIYEKNDSRFMDSFDHVLTVLVNQAQDDKNFDIPFEMGPIKVRTQINKINLGNNWYSDNV